MTGAFVIMGFGYLLALIVLALFLVECHLGVRKDREIDRLNRELTDAVGRRDFLARQNRALFGRCTLPTVLRPRRPRPRTRRSTR